MAELITVPTFTFNQGSIAKGDLEWECPIQVSYYDGCIELKQEGEFDINETIKIHPKYFEKLFREIRKHRPEATAILNKS